MTAMANKPFDGGVIIPPLKNQCAVWPGDEPSSSLFLQQGQWTMSIKASILAGDAFCLLKNTLQLEQTRPRGRLIFAPQAAAFLEQLLKNIKPMPWAFYF